MQSQGNGRNTKTKTKMEKSKEELTAECGRLQRKIYAMCPFTCRDCECERRTTYTNRDMDRLIIQHNYKLKLIRSMKKVLSIGMMVALALTLIAICLPCFLIFSTGADGEMTFWNWFGLGWLAMLVIVGKKVW